VWRNNPEDTILQGLYCSAVQLYNSLPCNIKKVASDLDRFKQERKDFLIEKAFYSVHEYLTLDSIEHN
jgi:hypothetical protein